MNGALQQLGQSPAAVVRLTLPAWKPDPRAGKKPEGDWHKLPDSFIGALKTAEPFVGRNHGVLLDSECAYATDNCVLIEIELGGAVPSATIPHWLIRHLIKLSVSPSQMCVSSRSIAFAWEDGSWVESAPCSALPANVIAKFEEWHEPHWEMTAAWKKEFRAIAKVSDETIILGPDHIRGGRGQLSMSSAVEIPVAEGTVWNPVVLGRVIKVAERIDFSSWPDPACFAFSGGRGFVVGKN